MIGIGFDLSSYTLLHSEPPLDDSFTKKSQFYELLSINLSSVSKPY